MGNLIDLARKLRPYIEQASKSLPDTDALNAVELFPQWHESAHYTVDTRVRYGGILYRCLVEHDAQATWTPDTAHSLWSKVLIPDPTVIPAWGQPDSTNPYRKGDKVTHKGKTWTSTADGNVWEPGVYGWEVV